MNLRRPRLFPATGLIAVLAVLAVGSRLWGNTLVEGALTEALLYLVLVVGLSIFVGNSGVVSFGHIGFAAIGAYASAWQTCCTGFRGVFMPGLPTFLLELDMPVVTAALLAGLLAALVAAVVGIAIMRLGGIAISIALLSLLFIVKSVYENWDSVTAGQSSLVGLPLYVDLWVALAWAAGAIVVAQIYQRSAFGLKLRAVRDDEAAARACGVTPWIQRLIAFVLSAFVAGVGGALYGHYLGTLAVSIFWLDMTFVTIAMLVLGGMRSLTGAVVGTLAVTATREILRSLERGVDLGTLHWQAPQGSQEIVLALILLGILVFRPEGLVGDRELGVRKAV
ncbi:MAG: branched-chain amino acid ABC transporter permease [Burkholderiales bacterium]|nr:branched-chain amino acid ABC transporter permease [Burkholderiales bacterium]